MRARARILFLLSAFVVSSAAPAKGNSGHAAPGAAMAAPGSGQAAASSAARAGGTRSTGSTGSGGMRKAYFRVPKLDPMRRIGDKDCTKPVVLDGSNLRCK